MVASHHRTPQGFTILETLTTLVITGILAAIAAPSWLSFLMAQDLAATNQKAFNAIRQAQTQATQTRQNYRISFRTNGDLLQYSIHTSSLADQATAQWQDLAENTNLQYKWGTFKTLTTGQYWYTEFDFNGNVERVRVPGGSGMTGRVIFTKSNSSIYRCTYISTILGAMRIDSNTDCLKEF